MYNLVWMYGDKCTGMCVWVVKGKAIHHAMDEVTKSTPDSSKASHG